MSLPNYCLLSGFDPSLFFGNVNLKGEQSHFEVAEILRKDFNHEKNEFNEPIIYHNGIDAERKWVQKQVALLYNFTKVLDIYNYLTLDLIELDVISLEGSEQSLLKFCNRLRELLELKKTPEHRGRVAFFKKLIDLQEKQVIQNEMIQLVLEKNKILYALLIVKENPEESIKIFKKISVEGKHPVEYRKFFFAIGGMIEDIYMACKLKNGTFNNYYFPNKNEIKSQEK